MEVFSVCSYYDSHNIMLISLFLKNQSDLEKMLMLILNEVGRYHVKKECQV